MSDDDLWRRPHDQQPGAEPPADEAGEPSEGGDAVDEGRPEAPVTDETQPISGVGSPPPPPSGPSSGSPSGASAGPSAVPPPANPYGQATGQQQPGWNPYADPRDPRSGAAQQPTTPYPQGYQPYGQGYLPPQNPYPPPQEFGAPQNPYGSPYQPAYAGGLLPAHPTATTSMVLAIIGLASIFVCGGVLLVLSPVAWVMGAKAVREMDGSPGRYSGRDRAMAGKVMGIIGTVLLVLGILLVVAIVAIVVNSDPSGPISPATNQNL
jgi:hypothetical protein